MSRDAPQTTTQTKTLRMETGANATLGTGTIQGPNKLNEKCVKF